MAIEVDVVAVEFGMSAHRCIEIDSGNLLGSHYFRCNGVASRNPFIRVFRLRVVSDVYAIAQRSCGSPNQLGLGRVRPDSLNQFVECLSIFCLAMLPTMHAVVELDYVE